MVSLETINIILSTMILLDIGLGAILFYLDKKTPANQLFALWMFALGGWTMTILGFFNASDAGVALGWMRAAYVEAILAVMSFWYFSTQFPEPKRLNPVVHIANAATLTLFGYLIMTTDLIVKDVTRIPWDQNVILNPVGWWIFAVYLIVYFLSAHLLLLKSYFRATGILKTQLLFLIVSVFFGVEVGGVVCNLLLPSPIFLNWSLIWLGPTLSTLIVVPFMAYAILKFRLFTIRTMVTQIVTGYIVLLSLLQLFLSRNVGEIFIRGLLAVGISVFGYMLVRMTNEEETQRLRLQEMTEKLATANKELRELDSVKSEFINIASHQLRTPVSVIKGYLALLEEGAYGKLPVKVKEKVRQMFEMNERLVHLINNFLNMSRIEKKRIEFLITPADIGRTVTQVVEEMRFEVQAKDIGIEFASRATPLPFVKADIEKVHEVMINLVDNAVKYSEPKSRIVVSTELDAAGDFVVVRVADGGIGLTQEERDRLFTKYYRAESKDMPHQQGSGLGLYICRTFIEGMGGRIWVDASEKGRGTTFAFALPVDKDDPARHQQPA